MMGGVSDLGKRAEQEAERFLVRLGYKILARNFRIRGGEIDLVALDNGTLVFIEVKARSGTLFGSPLEAITYKKLLALKKTAAFYQSTHSGLPSRVRFDAIEIYSSFQEFKINHIQNITL